MGISLENCGPKKGCEEFFVNEVKDPSSGPLYEVHTSQYLRIAWKTFKLYPLGFIGFSIIELIFFVAYIIIWEMFSPLLGFLLEVAISPIHVGIFIVCAKLLQRQPCVFKDFFLGFYYYKPLVIFGFIFGVICEIDYFFPQQIAETIIFAVLIVTAVIYFFTPMLIIDRHLNWWEAMEKSRQTVQRRLMKIFGFNLLLTIIFVGGIIALGVGSLITYPLVVCASTVAYADIFGLRSKKY
jgi:hypothetical protein